MRLRARGLTKTYGSITVLDDVDVEVAAGEVRALLGENGAGKSTLIKALSGAIVPDRGTVEVDGVALPWLDVELTTVVQPLADKGRATARAVLGRIAGEDVDDVVLPVTLRVGGSTGPASG